MRETLRNKRGSGGFTLVELLITIVIIGILAAVVVLAIGGLTNTGSKSACKATEDAALAGATAYYSDHAGVWPVSFTEMTAYLTPRPPAAIAAGGMSITGTGWTLAYPTSVPATGPTFTGCA